MPRNRLALAIRVGRKPELVSALERGNDRPHVLFVAVDDLVLHLEAIGNVDRTVLGHQITHVTVAGEDLEIFRSEEHTSELQSLMRISYAVFCLKKKK